MPYIIRYPKVTEITGLSRATIVRMTHAGTFPRPFQLGKRAVGWLNDDVQKWLVSRASSDQGGANEAQS